jgi:putative restriction endonuclease
MPLCILTIEVYSTMPNTTTVPWTREHRLIALNLYHKLPYGQLHKTTPAIVETASKMGRTASSLAMKLCNFASLDPVLAARNIKGLPGISVADRQQWNEFQKERDTLAPESEALLQNLFDVDADSEINCVSKKGIYIRPLPKSAAALNGTESTAQVKVRLGQRFFRQAVLTAYGARCCITNLAIPELLVASHILPWSQFEKERLDPCNGLCLSRLHDAAFDQGLMTFDSKFRLILSRRLSASQPEEVVVRFFKVYSGQCLRLTEKIAEPNPAFLKWHRENVFVG